MNSRLGLVLSIFFVEIVSSATPANGHLVPPNERVSSRIGQAAKQDTVFVYNGAKVRLLDNSNRTHPKIGLVKDILPDTLAVALFDDSGNLSSKVSKLAFDSIKHIEVAKPVKQNKRKSILSFGIAGALLGFTVGYTLGEKDCSATFDDFKSLLR